MIDPIRPYLSLWRGRMLTVPRQYGNYFRRGSRAALKRQAEAFCSELGLSVADLRRYDRGLTEVRQAVMFELYETSLWSLPEIGLVLHRDHTTVLHGIRRHRERFPVGDSKMSPPGQPIVRLASAL